MHTKMNKHQHKEGGGGMLQKQASQEKIPRATKETRRKRELSPNIILLFARIPFLLIVGHFPGEGGERENINKKDVL